MVTEEPCAFTAGAEPTPSRRPPAHCPGARKAATTGWPGDRPDDGDATKPANPNRAPGVLSSTHPALVRGYSVAAPERSARGRSVSLRAPARGRRCKSACRTGEPCHLRGGDGRTFGVGGPLSAHVYAARRRRMASPRPATRKEPANPTTRSIATEGKDEKSQRAGLFRRPTVVCHCSNGCQRACQVAGRGTGRAAACTARPLAGAV